MVVVVTSRNEEASEKNWNASCEEKQGLILSQLFSRGGGIGSLYSKLRATIIIPTKTVKYLTIMINN